MEEENKKNILWFKELGIKDVPLVGGKNASLGEMYNNLLVKGVNLANGFATTANAYFNFLDKSSLTKQIEDILKNVDIHDLKSLQQKGKKVRELIINSHLPEDLENSITKAYQELSNSYSTANVDVAVRSSATAEDLPGASFAGQQETFLNITGAENVLEAVKKCFASLFTNRAIVYRQEMGFSHVKVGLSAGIQKMVRSDLAASGVMFSCDTESGFGDVVLINASWGLGENVVLGRVEPDQYYVFETTLKTGHKPIIEKKIGSKLLTMIYTKDQKNPIKNTQTSLKNRHAFVLSDEEILQLAKWSMIVEDYYGKPMDMEWAKDGKENKLYIVQARPETVQSKRNVSVLEDYVLNKSAAKKVLVQGMSVGGKIGAGRANKILSAKDITKFKKGEILVTGMTDPDWVPAMKLASAIITDQGGRTCFGEETKILTNKGFYTIKEIVERVNKKEELLTPSINRETLEIEWKKILNGFERKSHLIKIDISQTGRMVNNFLRTTPDHKFLTFHDRNLVSKKIKDLISDKDYILSTQYIPGLEIKNGELNENLAYLLGGIITDGSIHLSSTHGEVQFIQKETKEKRDFIEEMNRCLQESFGYSFRKTKPIFSGGEVLGRKIFGWGTKFRCYSKEIAQKFIELENSIAQKLLSANEKVLYKFLAGVIDGDGSWHKSANRINIYCSDQNLLNALNVACLRLNLPFTIVKNRTINNFQIAGGIERIFQYTKRVKGQYNRIRIGTKLLAAKQILSDIIDKVNYKGRIRPYVANNLLIDTHKILRYVVPLIKGQPENHRLTEISNSSLNMLRVAQRENVLESSKVYNIEVEDNHNYIVFTERFTPILVENCHAAIVSRELGIPCIVGAGNATKLIKTGKEVTVDCSGGEEGFVYEGLIKFEVKKTDISKIAKPKTKISMNLGDPSQAFNLSFIPNDGVGLAREELIIANTIKIHPNTLIHYKKLPATLKKQIDVLTFGYNNKVDFYVDKLAEGVGKIGAAFYPKQVIVRFSDFRTNEYRELVGGHLYESADERNPMIGFRGASRYYDEKFKNAFILECKAIKKVREEFGIDNVQVMIPFCRTVEEGKKVLNIMEENRLKKSENGLKVYVMCEIPANVVLAKEFLEIFDGFSIGSNDLTQLTLGLDRDNSEISQVGNEKNEAVKELIKEAVRVCKKMGKYSGICGQAPSDFPDFAEFLVEQGIESISLNPDSMIKTMLVVVQKEKSLNSNNKI